MASKLFPKLLHHHAIGIVLSGKWDEIPCDLMFISLHNKDSTKKGNNLRLEQK